LGFQGLPISTRLSYGEPNPEMQEIRKQKRQKVVWKMKKKDKEMGNTRD
jgi:hypothetical protein